MRVPVRGGSEGESGWARAHLAATSSCPTRLDMASMAARWTMWLLHASAIWRVRQPPHDTMRD